MYIQRTIESYIRRMLKKFPIISLTGPRQSGKTTLLKSAFPDFKYFNLERIDHREMIMADPLGFLNSNKTPVILDEAQNLPELFNQIQVISDERNQPGQYILSGSQSFLLNQNISQSLAGRVSINHLFPFDINELNAVEPLNLYETILKGFYPRIYQSNIDAVDFYPSYLQTYIERDVRTLRSIGNLNTFTRFLSLCAGRTGQILNLNALANDTGISVNTAKAWISLLESSFIIFLLQPYHHNFNKRIIKSPKLYFYDTGIVCSLLKLTDISNVSTYYNYGSLFENLIISEIMKYSYHLGKKPNVYYWRESNGIEIDCIIEKDNKNIAAIEIKGGQSFTKDYLKNIRSFSKNNDRHHVQKILIYAGTENSFINETQIIPWKDFSNFMNQFLS